jgi:glucose/mannose-6-phosphate isomerase
MTASPDVPLLALAWATPQQMADAAASVALSAPLPLRRDIDTIAFLGMGSARTVGRAVYAVAAGVIPVPMLIGRGYDIPACIGPRSLVFALSGSGNTDEVDHAAAEAMSRGARLIALTSGGWLAEVAAREHLPCIEIPAIRPPRAAFGFLLAAVLGMLGRIGLLPPASEWIDDAIAQLRQRREILRRADEGAARLAGQLAGRHVVIQGDSTIGAVAAERWKAQINQSAKQPAAWSEQPDASHQEAVAWDAHMGDRSATDALVLLRHPFEDPRVSRRMALLGDHVRGRVPVHHIEGIGRSPLAALMDLILIGDVVALHMAAINGSDPASASFISDTLKHGLPRPAMPRAATK